MPSMRLPEFSTVLFDQLAEFWGNVIQIAEVALATFADDLVDAGETNGARVRAQGE